MVGWGVGNAKMGSSRVRKRWAEDVRRQGSAGGVAVSEGTQRWKEEGSS